MDKMDGMLLEWRMRWLKAFTAFKESEEGDTNFISMLLIIGIVVVLAGMFLTMGKGIMTTVTTMVQNWLSNLS